MKKFNEIVDKVITRLGTSNDSEICTAILAAFKLIFIPFATMADKKSSKEQKQYALTRDFLTEGVALMGYLGITKAVKNNLTAPICAKYYKEKALDLVRQNKLDINSEDFKVLVNIDKAAIKNHAMNEFLDEGVKNYTKNQEAHIKALEGIISKFSNIQNPKDLYLNTKKTISHVCVCVLALTLIPYITNKLIYVLSKVKSQDDKPKINVPIPKQTTLKPYSMQQYIGSLKMQGGLNVFSR